MADDRRLDGFDIGVGMGLGGPEAVVNLCLQRCEIFEARKIHIGLRQNTIGVLLDEHRLRRLSFVGIGDVLRRMRTCRSEARSAGRNGCLLGRTIGHCHLGFDIGQEYGNAVWMGMHDRFFAGSVLDPQDPHSLVFEFHGVVVRVEDGRIIAAGLPEPATRTTRSADRSSLKRKGNLHAIPKSLPLTILRHES